MLEILRTKKSWLTQRLANRFPPYSRLRKYAQSLGQLLLDPLGKDIEDVYWWTNYDLRNFLLNTSDTNQVQGLRYVKLPSTFTWQTREDGGSVLYLSPTSVRAQDSDGVWRDLAQATDNRLEEFWYGVPDRATATEDSFAYIPVLASTSISNLSNAAPSSPRVAGKLFLTLSNNGSSIKTYGGKYIRSCIQLDGRDIHGIENSERIIFPFNGTVMTKLAWSEIDSITSEYIDSTATLRVDWLSHGQTEPVDQFGVHIDRFHNEKFRFCRIGSESFGSTMECLTFGAADLLSVEDGLDTKSVMWKKELLSSSGVNLTATSGVLWPLRRFYVVSTVGGLHFFTLDIPKSDASALASRTTEVVTQIDIESEVACRGDTILLDGRITRPFIRLMRTRWSVLKPNGSRVCITPAGAEIAYSSSGWVEHREGSRNEKVGYWSDPIEYTLTASGRYTFYLDSTIADVLSEPGTVAEQTDVFIVDAIQETAASSVSLPVSVGTVVQAAFDAYGRPWVINNNGTATRLNFHYDKYLVDFTDKMVYFREDYSTVEVTP